MTSKAHHRARAYLANLPPAISGQGGHNATFRAACWLVRLGLSEVESMILLREFNQRCQPPWTEKELEHKLRDAHKVVRPAFPSPASAAPAVRATWSLEIYQSRGMGLRPASASPRLSPETPVNQSVASASEDSQVGVCEHCGEAVRRHAQAGGGREDRFWTVEPE